MKKRETISLARLVGRRVLIKTMAFLICFMMLFTSTQLFFVNGATEGKNDVAVFEISQKDCQFSRILEQYLDELGENGYYIHSTTFKDEVGYDLQDVIDGKVSDEQLYQKIKDNLVVTVLATKLSIDNDGIYYFKSEDSCNNFINSLKTYNNEIVVSTCGDIVDMNEITEEKILNDKIEEYRIEREAKEAAAAEQRRIEEEARKKKEAEEAWLKAQEQKRLEAEKREETRVIQNNNITSRNNNINEARSNDYYSNGNYQFPLDSYTCFSSPFGWRGGEFHTGLDIATPSGTPVHAWKAGRIVYASWCGTYGNYVRIQHNDGTESCYAHLSSYACMVGDYVNCHDIIAYSGSTGNSTGPHLHWEIKVNGQFVNPMNYL